MFSSIYDLRFTIYEVNLLPWHIINRKSPMTRHCHNCGEPWTLNGNPGRGEVCMKCRADLRVCLNCHSYDPRVAEQCRERRGGGGVGKNTGDISRDFDFFLRA